MKPIYLQLNESTNEQRRISKSTKSDKQLAVCTFLACFIRFASTELLHFSPSKVSISLFQEHANRHTAVDQVTTTNTLLRILAISFSSSSVCWLRQIYLSLRIRNESKRSSVWSFSRRTDFFANNTLVSRDFFFLISSFSASPFCSHTHTYI